MQQGPAVLATLGVLAAVAAARAGPYPIELWESWRARESTRRPGATWLMYAAPEEAGWSLAGLEAARAHCETLDAAGVMVVYDGAVLAAWGDVTTRYLCHSIRKSLLSALYGIHVAAGRIDLDSTLAGLAIDDEPPLTDAEKQARVIDLLRSRSGVYHTAAYETATMKKARPERGSQPPGARFWYNNWDFNALCTIFEQATGTRVFEEFGRRLAAPLQMEDFRVQDGYYHREPQHSVHPAYPLRMSARDMARFGLLYLRQGRWGEAQVLPEPWVRESTASTFRPGDAATVPAYGYGYLWWPVIDGPFRELGMYSARGFGGHAIDVLPLADLVVVLRVDTFDDMTPAFGAGDHRVADTARFQLLDLILRARVGPPSPSPRLVPLPPLPPRHDLASIDPTLLARYAGEYDFGTFALRVRLDESGLWLTGPRMGAFRLLPRSETEFVLEDVAAPVLFDLAPDGQPVRATLELAPDQRVTGAAVQATR